MGTGPCFATTTSFWQLPRILAELAVEATAVRLTGTGQVGLLLTGGKDSRLVLGCLLEDKSASEIVAFTYGRKGVLDAELPAAVPRAAGVRHVLIDSAQVRTAGDYAADGCARVAQSAGMMDVLQCRGCRYGSTRRSPARWTPSSLATITLSCGGTTGPWRTRPPRWYERYRDAKFLAHSIEPRVERLRFESPLRDPALEDLDLTLPHSVHKAWPRHYTAAVTQRFPRLFAVPLRNTFSLPVSAPRLGDAFAGTAFAGTAFAGTAFAGTAFAGTAFAARTPSPTRPSASPFEAS